MARRERAGDRRRETGGVVVVGGVSYLLIEQMQRLFFYCVLYILPMRGTYKHLAKIIN